MSYLNVKQTIKLFKKDLPNPCLPFGLPQLADLCRRGTITPVFPYNRYVADYTIGDLTETDFLQGYLSHHSLISLIDKVTDNVTLTDAMVIDDVQAGQAGHYEGARVYLLVNGYDFDTYQRAENHKVLGDNEDAFNVTLEDLRFPIQQVHDYININNFEDISTPEQQRIAELESQLAQANADNDQLRQQINTPIKADESQGDTLLILGAVIACIKEVAKPNYTQQLLITAITDKYKNTTSLTESTLTKKFPAAKKYLKQKLMP